MSSAKPPTTPPMIDPRLSFVLEDALEGDKIVVVDVVCSEVELLPTVDNPTE